MASSLSSPSHSQTAAFKEQVRRHCEQKFAQNLTKSSSPPNRSIPTPGFTLHGQGTESPVFSELRRSSDGQLPPMFPRKDHPFVGSPPTMSVPRHTLKTEFSELRRSSDGQLQPTFPVSDQFVGAPPRMIPKRIQRETDSKFNAELRRSSDGQLQPLFPSSKDHFAGPPPMMIPKHIQQQSGTAELQVSPKEFRVDVDAAAYEPEELDVKIVGDHVVISGKHAEGQGSPGGKANISREFSRRYTLPEDVIVEEVSVFLAKSGKLSVKVPRKMAVGDRPHTKERKSKVKFQE